MAEAIRPYELNADILLGAALSGDIKAIVKSLIARQVRAADFPDEGYYRATYNAIVELLREQRSVSPEAVFTRTNQRVPLEWLGNLYALYGTDAEQMLDAADTLIAYAEARNAYQAGQEMLKDLAANPLDARKIAGQYGSKLLTPRSRGTLLSFPKNIRSRAKSAPQVGEITPTGIGWLDYYIEGGLQTKYQLGIASRQKGRKTSFVRNLVLQSIRVSTDTSPHTNYEGITLAQVGTVPTAWEARENMKVAFLAYENDQVRSYYDFVAMLAFEFLWKRGGMELCHQRFGERYFHEFCSSPIIMRADLNDKIRTIRDENEEVLQAGWPAPLQGALSYAFTSMDKLSEAGSLAIYDSEERTGNLFSIADMERVLMEHSMLYCKPTDHFVFVVDYLGLVRKEGESNKYTAQQAVNASIKKAVSNLVDGLGATALSVAQYNTQTKREKIQGIKSDPMPDSNPDLRRDVQTFIETEYDYEETGQKLTISILDNRRGEMNVSRDYWIHPPSGYMVGYFNPERLFERSNHGR